MIPRVPKLHGHRQVVVRGTVIEVTPAKTATGFFSWLKNDIPAVVRINIDDEPYRRLQNILTRATEGRGIVQTFGIGWNVPDPVPSSGNRVWVTFGYAGSFETFFEGAPIISYKRLEIIEDEWDTREDELTTDEPALPLKVA